MKKPASLLPAALLALAGLAVSFSGSETPPPATTFAPQIPRTWDDAVMANLELPLAHAPASPKHAPAEYYYRMRVRPIYKSYPVYHPSKEPPGYIDELRRKEPVVLWDDKGKRPKLETEADWIAAGELVFDSPLIFTGTAPTVVGVGRMTIAATSTNLFVRETDWYEQTGAPVTREGILPFYTYFVREKGIVELGVLSCAMCHTRVMPDGVALKGPQGNFPFGRAFGRDMRDDGGTIENVRLLDRSLYAAPWIRPNPQARLDEMSVDEIASAHEAVPPGVIQRHRASPLSPVVVANLIGVKDRRFLDASGLQHHRNIGDMMRYAALNQTGDDHSSFDGFIPAGKDFRELPELTDPLHPGRYSDEQLYALALYLYSLKPPPNPNLPKTAAQKALVERGREVFDREDCARCHKPPLYTNNKLMRAPGFQVPDNHPAGTNIMRQSIGTDPTLTTQTRRGTGFYKVPSLLGAWYRGPFEHNGSCATLEDWFDERRLRDDYVPTGWRGPPGIKTRAVKGHEFGLDLSVDERKALIAFLRTL